MQTIQRSSYLASNNRKWWNNSREHLLTFKSVLRTQMKVQTDGLLLDLRTTNPPGPFSPLRPTIKKGRREVKEMKLTQLLFYQIDAVL